MNKQSRHFTIKEIVTQKRVSSQEELCEELRKAGYEVTQATLSRDLRELGIVRVHTEGGARYTLLKEEQERKLGSFIGYEVDSISCNESLIVIKTLSGFASGVAEFIDSLHHPDILGTIAGDNTIFVTPISVRKTKAVMKYIKKTLMQQTEVPSQQTKFEQIGGDKR